MRSGNLRFAPKAFTLVELLVVIGLIAVLIALLSPSIVNARRNALTAGCAMNLKNIGLAVTAYTMDNEDAYPTTCGVGWRSDNWIYWEGGRTPGMDFCPMARYLNLKGASLMKVMTCPAQPIEDNVGFQNGAAYPITYSMNYSVSIPWADPTDYNPPRPLRRGGVKNASDKILVYDENQNADDDQFWYGTDRDTLAGRHGINDSQNANLNGVGEQSVVRGLGNCLFVDGHVALVDNNFCHTQFNNDLTPKGQL